jgi:hypothetical protein
MSLRDAIFTTGVPEDAIGQEVGKPMPSVATPIVAMPLQGTIFAADGQWDTKGHQVAETDAECRDAILRDATTRRHILPR